MGSKRRCLKRSFLRNHISHITQISPLDEKTDADFRVEITDIKRDDFDQVLSDFSFDHIEELIKGRIAKNRLQKGLDSLQENKKLAKSIIDDLSDADVPMRHVAIALNTLFSTIHGEVNKANNYGVDLISLGPDNDIPRVPLNRLAATIGRQIALAEGFHIGLRKEKGEDGKYRPVDPDANATDVEYAYYQIGNDILSSLHGKGIVTLHDAKEGLEVIKDWTDEKNKKAESSGFGLTTGENSISVNLKAFNAATPRNKPNGVVNYFLTGSAKEGTGNEYFDTLITLLNTSNVMSIPQRVLYPGIGESKANPGHKNVATNDATTAEAMEKLETNPVHLDNTLHGLFKSLHHQLKGGSKSASSAIFEMLQNKSNLRNLFKMEDRSTEIVVSNEESAKGRSLSKTTPIDDLVEFFHQFDGDTPQDLFFNYFMGRNGRQYTYNSVVDFHASKAMRNSLSVDAYTLDLDSEAYDFFVNKIVLDMLPQNNGESEIDYTKRMDSFIEGAINNTGEYADRISKAIKALDLMNSATTPVRKLGALSNISMQFPDLDMGSLVTRVQALKDIRDSVSSGKLTTEQVVTSDATASGVQLKLQQALGANPKGITELLKRLKVFKAGEGESITMPLNDAYDILQKNLEIRQRGEELENNLEVLDENPHRDSVLADVVDMLFSKNLRNLSKSPVMTINYGQSKEGAQRSIAEKFADKMISKIERAKTPKELNDIQIAVEKLVDLGGKTLSATVLDDQYFKKDLIAGYVRSGVPKMLYHEVNRELVDEYLEQYNSLSSKVFNLVSSYNVTNDYALNNLRVFPAGYVMDKIRRGEEIDYSKDDEFKVPLSKQFEQVHEKPLGDTVLTKADVLRETVMNVSMIHTIDAAILYHTIADLPSAYDKSGMLVVHDEYRGRADMVMEADKIYVQKNREAAQQFDILENTLLSMNAFLEKNGIEKSHDKRYTKLLQEVADAKAIKNSLLSESEGNYDTETNSVIGDRVRVTGIGQRIDPATRAEAKARKAESTSKVPEKAVQEPKQTRKVSAEELIQSVSDLLDEADYVGVDKNKIDKALSNPSYDDKITALGDLILKAVNELSGTKAKSLKEVKVNSSNTKGATTFGDLLDAARAAENEGTLGYDHDLTYTVKDEERMFKVTQEVKELSAKLEGQTIRNALKEFSDSSPIIKSFLGSTNPSKLESSAKPQFSGREDTLRLPNLIEGKGQNALYASKERLTDVIEHEIIHSYTVGYINKWDGGKGFKSVELEYINKAIDSLQKIRKPDGSFGIGDAYTESRLQYALNLSASPDVRMKEFIAVMGAEPDVSEAVYTHFNKFGKNNRLKAMLKRVRDRIVKAVMRVQESDLDFPVEFDKLYSSIAVAIVDGKSFREHTPATNAHFQSAFSARSLGFGPVRPAQIVTSGFVSYANNAMAQYLNDPAIRTSGNLIRNVNQMLSRFPSYQRAVNRAKGIYDDSKTLQSLVHKITNDNINNEKKNELLSLFAGIKADSAQLKSKELQRLKAFTKRMTPAELSTFNDFVGKMSMADYFKYSVDRLGSVDQAIADLEASGKFTDRDVRKIDSIVDLNVEGKVDRDTVYNLDVAGYGKGDLRVAAAQMLALKSIKAIGVGKFEKMSNNTGLMEVLRDVTMANEVTVDSTPNLAKLSMRDNRLTEEYEEPVSFIGFTKKDLNRIGRENSGWVILQEPEGHTPGVAYRKTIDSTYQDGVFTTINAGSSDVSVSKELAGMNNVIKVGDDYKLILTQDQKNSAGLLKDPSQSLVGTMVHNMEIKDSQIIRDKLLEHDTNFNLDNKTAGDLVDIMKDSETDNPWMLSVKDDFSFAKIEDEAQRKFIEARYTAVPVNLSNVGGFSKGIKYVRKDIAYWLVGSAEPSIANDKKLQWAVRITKDLVAGTKIGMVILNPLKIAMDNVSNVSYLSVMGVSPAFISKQYRTILKEFNEYKNLRNSLNELRMRSYSEPSKYAAQIKTLEERLKRHPGNGFVERGFINSLGSELVMNTDDPSSGFKSDIDFVLKKIFTEKGERNNKLGAFIMKASKLGFNVEEVLETWTPLFGKVDSGKELESSLNVLADRIKDIKSEDDIVDYVHQYINSPNSEMVKLGTHMTDLADITAKETYYRYLVQNGIEPKKAELEVIDSFPDYKEGMPTRVKQLSDMGILMFPSYWIRIQKAIYRMVKNKPISFGTEMAIQDLLNFNTQNIFDQNIVNKSNSFFGLVHTPWEHLGVGSILPTNIL